MSCTDRNQDACLFYLVGPSGAGKDTLIDYCRPHLQPAAGVRIARRYITRPPTAGGEAHIALTAAEFEQRRAAGRFALHWQANGLCYGIGSEIDDWLDCGMRVLVNGSRAHVVRAQQRYGRRLLLIEVRAAPATVRKRLMARDREPTAAVAARTLRNQRLQNRRWTPVATIANDGTVADAGQRLLALFTARRIHAISGLAPDD